jgi:hypothetical protein
MLTTGGSDVDDDDDELAFAVAFAFGAFVAKPPRK